MDTYRVVVADNQTMTRRGISRILEAIQDVEIIGEAKNGFELLNLLKDLTPHMVMVDTHMPDLRGMDATRAIKTIDPLIKVLILSEQKRPLRLHQAVSEGADGYLLKEDEDAEILLAVEKIRKGKKYISSSISQCLTDEFSQMLAGDYEPPSDPLTVREREITRLIAEGKTSREIASTLFISVRTVECHRGNIMRKLNLSSMSELVRYAVMREMN